MHWSRFTPKLVQLPNTNYPGGTTHLTGQDVWLTDTKINTKTATEQNWNTTNMLKDSIKDSVGKLKGTTEKALSLTHTLRNQLLFCPKLFRGKLTPTPLAT